MPSKLRRRSTPPLSFQVILLSFHESFKIFLGAFGVSISCPGINAGFHIKNYTEEHPDGRMPALQCIVSVPGLCWVSFPNLFLLFAPKFDMFFAWKGS